MIAIGDPTVMESGQLEADIADRQTDRRTRTTIRKRKTRRERESERTITGRETKEEALRFLLRYKWLTCIGLIDLLPWNRLLPVARPHVIIK